MREEFADALAGGEAEFKKKGKRAGSYQISEQALSFLVERTQVLHGLVKAACENHLVTLAGEITKEKQGIDPVSAFGSGSRRAAFDIKGGRKWVEPAVRVPSTKGLCLSSQGE
ncbi:hypothetical protein GHK50_32660 [Sinorhizobium medicae]|uniref:Uncharacterized protein n=1 Tax=Sinorhizobium medicae TaxID=110321 RepID=A0A6G1WUP9_9HYPH|nr:hypothetical protein [Sinorhizobium medicae]MQV96813.1 hypothetical protein [Sinorhizobium medicae]MQW73335.1 hypothetical protein [Sinorhizobium medicae]MQX87614.1 hypothetical protein [Sinorhizobium medicae]MQX98703.1 hypothetical protein [Sinorhizobium medicae]